MGAAALPLCAEEGATESLLEERKRGKAPEEFDPPIGIAVSGSDLIHITDFRNHRVQRYSTDGRLVEAQNSPWQKFRV